MATGLISMQCCRCTLSCLRGGCRENEAVRSKYRKDEKTDSDWNKTFWLSGKKRCRFFWSWLLSDMGTGCSERLKNLHLWRTAAASAVTLSNLWLNFKVSSNLEAGPSLGSVGTRWPPEVFCSSKYWVIFLMMFQVSIQSSTMVWISWYLSLCSSLFAVAYGLDNYLFFLVCADLDMVLAFLLSFA